MPKNILFCADGTWNGPEDAAGESALDGPDIAQGPHDTAVTNVVKLYANLDGATTAETVAMEGESEKLVRDASDGIAQISKYLHGVGDSSNILVKMMGGVFGIGVIARIVRGYTFISRNYADGDQIHICGFSRGAYTARALAGVIAAVGLLDPSKYDANSKMQAYRLGVAAWAKAKTLQLTGAGRLNKLAQAAIVAVEDVMAAKLSNESLRPAPVASVAVWDTVGSLGIPEYVKGARVDLFRFVDTTLSDKVRLGYHAMAVDEQRCDFPVTKWTPRQGIAQMWFVGAHADVGGGYAPAESRLSDVGLDWMTSNLQNAGVRFLERPAYSINTAAAISQAIHTPWTQPPFDHLGCAWRSASKDDLIHPAVRERWQADASYRPRPLNGIL